MPDARPDNTLPEDTLEWQQELEASAQRLLEFSERVYLRIRLGDVVFSPEVPRDDAVEQIGRTWAGVVDGLQTHPLKEALVVEAAQLFGEFSHRNAVVVAQATLEELKLSPLGSEEGDLDGTQGSRGQS